MKKSHLALLSLLFGAMASTTTYAHDSIGFNLNIGRPSYYAPPTVYYSPPPVVYYEPRPVYREYYGSTAQAYYTPRGYYYDHRRWGGHHRHHEHDDDDD